MIVEGLAIHIMRKAIIAVVAILIIIGLLLGYRGGIKKQEQHSHYIVVTNHIVVHVQHEYQPTKFVPGLMHPVYTNINQLPIIELPAVRQFLSDQSK